MPRKRITAHLRAARTCNSVLTSLLMYANRDSATEQLEQAIRQQRVEALLAAERTAGRTSDRPFARPRRPVGTRGWPAKPAGPNQDKAL
jgi:hypothetical protein